MQATRYDEDKPRLSLLPPELLMEVGKVMTFGAKKYGDHNWELGQPDGACISACLRHLTKYMAGKYVDEESGLPHLAHAAANLGMQLYYDNPYQPVANKKTLAIGYTEGS